MSDLFDSLSDADLENLRDSALIAKQNKQDRIDSQAKLKRQNKAERARKKRRSKAKNDFEYFCQTYLSEIFYNGFSDYQRAFARLVSTRRLQEKDEALFKGMLDTRDICYLKPAVDERYDGILDIEPRDHGKTTRNTQALPLWIALNDPNAFVVICGASKTAANEMMDGIKDMLETDEQLIEDYGVQKVTGNTWSMRKIQLANGAAIASVGRGQRLRGIKDKFKRPTHVICDDLIEDKEVENPLLRKQAEKWFKSVVLNLGKGALTIVTNTIMHPDDLPSRLLNQIKEDSLPNWVGLRFSAILPNGRPLFPERWSLRDLEKKRETLGRVWWTEYMNRPIADDEAAFQEAWFQYFMLHELDLRDCDIAMAVDPATGSKNGDYSAIAVVARSRITQIDYVLFADGWRESDLKFARRIVDVYKMFRPTVIHFEEVAFQKIYKKEVIRYSKQQGERLPITGFKGGNKEMRIKSLSSMVENGFLVFLKGQRKAIDQFLSFPRDHDDIPDAIEMCISGFDATASASGVTVKAVTQAVQNTTARAFARLGLGARGRMLR